MSENEKVKKDTPNPFRGFMYYLRCNWRKMPRLVNLEITKKCNARCGFCACWQDTSSNELEDYAPIIKKIRPVVVSVSGGEPLVRKNYDQILANLRPYCHYLGIITNGSMLNDKSARKLVDAGVNHISVSLDYIGSRHDEMRKITGLYDHISKTIPTLAAKGYNIVLNTVIMESNLDQVLPIAYLAKEWGVSISYSSYCSLKQDDDYHMVGSDKYSHLVQIVDEIKVLKNKYRHIKSSDYYLDGIPTYFRNGGMPNCRAGFRWIQVTPDGYIKQCSELPNFCHYTEFGEKQMRPAGCTKCWYSCRGEAEANPLKPKRLIELIKA